jgi:DNA-binding SARP family transcriptional activator/tetratricopeptide (TPR) repeat protein
VTPRLEFGLLGPLLVRRDEVLSPLLAGKQRVLLAALLLNGGRTVSSYELTELLWEAEQPASARITLQNYVKRLRQSLGDGGHDLIATRGGGYAIDLGVAGFDVPAFEGLVTRARESASTDRWDRAALELRDALGLWRGAPLADIACDQLAREHVPRLAELRLQATELRITADLQLGLHDELVAELRQLITAEPLRERLHALIMLALYRAGRRSDALAAYRDACRVLADELGVEPGTELRRLHGQVLHGKPAGPDQAGLPRAASRPALAVPRQLPGPVTPFIGRRAELKVLDGMLGEGRGSTISIISGTAGIGKTALAVYWAHRVAERFPDGQLYVDLRGFGPAGTPTTPAEAIRSMLDSLLVPAERIPADLDGQAALYRSLLDGRRMLVVLDNAREAAQVRPLLPGTPDNAVVVTSRDQLIGLSATQGSAHITLDVLGEAEARELLAGRLGAEREAREPEASAQIASMCACLPLALSIVASRAAAHPAFPLSALTSELRDVRGRLDVLDAGEAAASIRAAFSWSYQGLSTPAARMFRLLGLHPGPDITVAAASSLAALPTAGARAALSELARSHLVSEHAAGRFVLHDLLRVYAIEQADAQEAAADRQAAVRRVLDHYLHSAYAMSLVLDPSRVPVGLTPPQPGVQVEDMAGYQEAWDWAEAERLVLLAVIAGASGLGFGRHAWQVSSSLETFLLRRGHWHDLADSQRAALAAAGQAGDRTGQAHARSSLGRACTLLGAQADARAHLTGALELFRALGDQAGEALARIRMCTLSWRQSDYDEAFTQAQQALGLFRACGRRAGEAGARNNIGWYHFRLGDHERGFGDCQQALRIFRAIGDRRGEANVLDSLGFGYQGLGRQDEAIECFSSALRVFRELGDRYNQAEILTHLAASHQDSGNLAAAVRYWEQALAILAELNHPDAADVLARLRRLDADRRHGDGMP